VLFHHSASSLTTHLDVFEIVEAMVDRAEQKLWQIKLDGLTKTFSGRRKLIANIRSAEETFEGQATLGREDGLASMLLKTFFHRLRRLSKVFARGKLLQPSRIFAYYGIAHRHFSNIDCLMACTACPVCFISTVNSCSKKKVFNFRSGHLHDTTFLVLSVKLPNLKLKTQPKQLLGSLPLVIELSAFSQC
jgi:hypothetical protein